MSQNTLIEKIKQDAAATIAEIKASETAEAEGIQRETEAAIVALTKAHTEALRKKQAQMELVAVSRAKQAGNIAIQTAKRNQIDTIFADVRKELEGQSDEAYVTFFQKYVGEIVPKEVVVTAVEAPATRQDVTKKILCNLGLSAEVTTNTDIKAGLIVKAGDGVYDITLDRLMGEKRAELEMIVVNKVMT
jgi:vacuolar-type H+-ATPase subunit E/Vma4